MLPVPHTMSVSDLVVQRAVQHELAELQPVQPRSYRYLAKFLGHDFLTEECRLDGLRCSGDEYLLALQVAPRKGDVEPACLTARVAAWAARVAETWVHVLSQETTKPQDEDHAALERWCTLQAIVALVEQRARKLQRAADTSNFDLAPEFVGGDPTTPSNVLAAQANLATVASFAAAWMPKLVDGGFLEEDPLDDLAHWDTSDLPGGYLVDGPSLAIALRACRDRVARQATQRLIDFKNDDLFDFLPQQRVLF